MNSEMTTHIPNPLIVLIYYHHMIINYFSGHQKESNAKDCLLIIDHVTGEITLEKLSSQLMVNTIDDRNRLLSMIKI